jgi:hypothetical protein
MEEDGSPNKVCAKLQNVSHVDEVEIWDQVWKLPGGG